MENKVWRGKLIIPTCIDDHDMSSYNDSLTVFGKSKKHGNKPKNLEIRQTDAEIETNGDTPSSQDNVALIPTKPSKSTESSHSSRSSHSLSFQNDEIEEEPVFQLKKKVAARTKPKVQVPDIPAAIVEDDSPYFRFSELKRTETDSEKPILANVAFTDDLDEEVVEESSKPATKISQASEPADMVPALENDDLDEITEEDTAWELERISRSGIKRLRTDMTRLDSTFASTHHDPMSSLPKSVQSDILVLPRRIVEPLSIESVLKKVDSSLAEVSGSFNRHASQQAKLQSSLNEINLSLQNGTSSLSQIDSDLDFLAHTKVFIFNLIDCIESKQEQISGLEKEDLSSRQRFAASSTDQFKRLFQNRFMVVNFNISNTLTPEGDLTWQDFRSKRYTRRSARSAKRRHRNPQIESQLDDLNGYSSDEGDIFELPQTRFDQERFHLDTQVQQVFEDTVPKFASLSAIIPKFEEFRSKQRQMYDQFGIGNQLAPLVSSFVRLAMLTWQASSSSPTSFPWYFTCTSFDQNKGSSPSLTNELLTSIIVPKLKQFLSLQWLPTQSAHNSNLQISFTSIKPHLNETTWNDLASHWKMVIQGHISALEIPQDAAGPEDFSTIAFGRSLKILDALISWIPCIGSDQLQVIMWDILVQSRVIPYLEKLRDGSLLWDRLRCLLHVLGPWIHSKGATRLRNFIDLKEEESLGHYGNMMAAEEIRTIISSLPKPTL